MCAATLPDIRIGRNVARPKGGERSTSQEASDRKTMSTGLDLFVIRNCNKGSSCAETLTSASAGHGS